MAYELAVVIREFCREYNGLDRSCVATNYSVLDKLYNSGGSGGLNGLALLQIKPPVVQVFFMIGAACGRKNLPDGTHYVSRSVFGVELIAMLGCTMR